MPDTKITALTAITTVDPAVDVLPIVDVSDTTMAASGTTKKITSNQILGAGGTATLASATITGDLTVDTSTLKVNSSANRVGVLTASPESELDVRGLIAVRGTPTFPTTGVGPELFWSPGNSNSNLYSYNRGTSAWAEMAYGASNHIFQLSGVNAMTLNSTGLGIGVTPSYKLDVSSTSNIVGRVSSSSVLNTGVNIVNTTGSTWSLYSFGSNDATLQNSFGIYHQNGTSFLQITQSGNVGIGVTPKAWSGFRSLDIGAYGGFLSTNLSAYASYLGNNCFYDGTGWKFIGATNAVHLEIAGGDKAFKWFRSTNATPTAGGTITFEQAMTLDASGNLLVGVASSGNRLDVQKSTDCTVLVKSTGANVNVALDYISTYGNNTIRKNGSAVWDYGVINDSSATPAFKISNASSVGVQLVSGATAWTTLSDETLKDIIEPISNAVAKVGSLRSVIGKFKTDDSGKRRSFLIAQDVQSVLPEAVDVVGENSELGLRYTEVIPLLVAAIKELTAEVNALKNA